MKHIILSLSFLLTFFCGTAQNSKPILAANTELDYLVIPRGGGIATITLRINFASADSMNLVWTMGNESGRYLMSRQALKHAISCTWERPVDGAEVLLNGNQTLLAIPDAAFQQLTSSGQMEFDGQIFKKHGEEEMTIGSRKLKTLHLKSNNGETEYWVVDDAHALIVKVTGNTYGPNVELQNIR